ncbi:hypothetical protein IAQ61_002315 [Plenodomus lingam]|uniref:uncharacterized protein n=1 Tax=Leptosphaeria maculans TaxID=5022 RepID=UPI0033274F51|nr:hypothetical protein IAQ61_002315 [Plenodomus lingam]
MNISAQEYTQNIAKSTSKSTTTTKVTTSFDLAPVSTGSPDITDLVTLMRSPSTDIAASPEREQETRTRQQDVDSHHPTTTTPWGSITEGRHYVNPPLPWDSPQQAQHIPAANTNPTTQLLNGTTTQQPPPLNPPAPNFSANTTFPSTARPIPTGLPHNPWLPRSPPTPLATSENRDTGYNRNTTNINTNNHVPTPNSSTITITIQPPNENNIPQEPMPPIPSPQTRPAPSQPCSCTACTSILLPTPMPTPSQAQESSVTKREMGEWKKTEGKRRRIGRDTRMGEMERDGIKGSGTGPIRPILSPPRPPQANQSLPPNPSTHTKPSTPSRQTLSSCMRRARAESEAESESQSQSQSLG